MLIPCFFLLLFCLVASQTLDPCSSTLPCPAPHVCSSLIGPSVLAPCTSSCFCFPPLPLPCTDSKECTGDEQCAFVPPLGVQLCISSLAAAYLPVTPVSPLRQGNSPGLTLDTCRDKCTSPRKCYAGSSGPIALMRTRDPQPCAEDDTKCFCLPEKMQSCKGDSDCVKGEVCSKLKGEKTFCASETAVTYVLGLTPKDDSSDPGLAASVPAIPSASPSEEPHDGSEANGDPPNGGESVAPSASPQSGDGGSEVTRIGCVDVGLLHALERDQLVFEEDRLARVLCDSGGSCATAGHMVWWDGKAMMMSRYCKLVDCKEEVRWVNSPRYSWGGRVPSRTGGLEFTVFAAKYESWVEEGLLAALVRLGV